MMSTRPIQSYKNITIDGPASRSAATNIVHVLSIGIDNYVGPTSANNEVPTGASVSSLDVQLAFTNLVSISANLVFTVQAFKAGLGVVTPNAQGGNAQRNQVLYTRNIFLGHDQNSNFHFRVKIPKGKQRVGEGDQINLVYRCDAVFASVTQAIYKFYR